jgi:hypothetical protein
LSLKSDILYRLDTGCKTDEEKLKIIEEIQQILQERIEEKTDKSPPK